MTKKEIVRVLRGRFAIRFAGLIACMIVLALAAYGQGNRGSITGTITDPQGGVAPNAALDVKNMDTGEVFHGGTSGTGNYVIPVPAGRYELAVTAPGFKKYVRGNIQVGTASDTREDVKLELGAVSDTITVTDEAPLLKTESGEISHTMTTDDIDQLPVLTTNGSGGATGTGNIRNPLQEMILLPGTAFGNDTFVVVNGLTANSETIRTEGQDSTSNIFKMTQQNSQGGVEAIQEVAIQTSNFAAEYGQAAGGYFNYTMKSGTNQYHGSGYDYFVNEALNAGTPFTNAGLTNSLKDGQLIRNRIRRNDYGATFGGPVRIPKLYDGRNKTFFFVNFEQFRQSNLNGTTTDSVPTPAYEQGNFQTALCSSYVGGAVGATGGTCNAFPAITSAGQPAIDPAGTNLVQGQIFNPYSTTISGGQQVRVPFSNNTIPFSLQDPVALALQKLLPQANQPGDINNLNVPAYKSFSHTTNFSVKMDQSLSSTIKISGYYTQLKTYSPDVNGGITPLALGGTDTDQWNHTTRLNYDQTITPTLLFHAGIGYFETSEPHLAYPFAQSSIGLTGYQANNIMPDISGLLSTAWQGGYSPGGFGATFSATAYEEKPTANTSLTWIRGNHTFKAGGDYTQEGYPDPSQWRANGNFTFAAAETADPWQNTQTLSSPNPTGFSYASYLLGLPDSLNLNANTDTKLGYHQIGVFAQDSWKVTHKLTVDYGLRYDYQTYMKEQYGRMGEASFNSPDTALGVKGTVIYGATCNCQFSHNYPFAFGPRIGAAYQLDSKTVLRGGGGIQYDVEESPGGILYSAADYTAINSNGYGISPMQNSNTNQAMNGLQGGNPYAVGNPYGNPPVVWPNFNADKYPVPSNGILAPSGGSGAVSTLPFIFFDPHNRPGRVFTWSLGLQREVLKNLVMEVSYVGNRGAYFPAPNMDQIASNSLQPAQLMAQFGLNINNAADRQLLLDSVSNPAVQARFPVGNPYIPGGLGTKLVNGVLTVPTVYPGFPAAIQLEQALKNNPQWGGVSPWLGPPLGDTWYDSMQVKVTKRYSHGLQAAGNFTWAKGLVDGASSDSTYYLGSQPAFTDIYNFGINKQLNQYVRPLAMTITFTYTTPKFSASGFGMRTLSQVARDWQIGAVLRYQSGALIGLPASLNNLTSQLGRIPGGFTSNFGSNFWNVGPGTPCRCLTFLTRTAAASTRRPHRC